MNEPRPLPPLAATSFPGHVAERLPLATALRPAGTDHSEVPGTLGRLSVQLRDYNENYDKQADYFTSDARHRYIEADRSYFSWTGRNLRIHSGLRTVVRQAQLYVDYKWHNTGNPASWPGCSMHNWGFAADMIRGDERNVEEAMNSGGWYKTHKDEGWHFECTDSPDHRIAADHVSQLRRQGRGLSYRWSEEVAYFYQKSYSYNDRAQAYSLRVQSQTQAGQGLETEVWRFNAARDAFAARQATYNTEVETFRHEHERAQKLYDEILEMPPGPDREESIVQYESLVAWLEEESARLEQEHEELGNIAARLENDRVALEERIASYDQEATWLEAEYQALGKLHQEISKHETNSNHLLEEIDRFVAGSL